MLTTVFSALEWLRKTKNVPNEGWFSRVERGVAKNGQECATKLFERNAEAKFVAEKQILMDAMRDNCIGIVEYFSFGDYRIELELAKGSLEELLSQPYEISDMMIKQTIRGLTTAVEYLHDKGIAHRDIRPASILWFGDTEDDSFRLKLCNFGDAIKLKDNQQFEKAGKLAYMAPEIAVLCPAKHAHSAEEPLYYKASDIWSLGAVFYWVMTGRLLPQVKCECVATKMHANQPCCTKDTRDMQLCEICVNYFKCKFFEQLVAIEDRPRDLPHTARHFLLKLLQFHPARRITAAQIPNELWTSGTRPWIRDIYSSLESIREEWIYGNMQN